MVDRRIPGTLFDKSNHVKSETPKENPESRFVTGKATSDGLSSSSICLTNSTSHSQQISPVPAAVRRRSVVRFANDDR
jgi:hypothetical protein